MKAQQVRDYFRRVETPPSEPHDRTGWVEGRDVIGFLQNSATGDVPVCFLRRDFFIYAVLVPEEILVGDYADDLMKWNFPVSHGWEYMAHDTDGDIEAIVHAPGQVVGSAALNHAEPIIYERSFSRRGPDQSYVEANQKLIHLTDLHWLDDRNSFCRLDEHGDIVDAIKLHQQEPGLLCTIDIETLHRYLAITRQALVQLFDVHRCVDWSQWRFYESRDQEETRRFRMENLIIEKVVLRSTEGVDRTTFRGVQILRAPSETGERRRLLRGTAGDEERQESFIIHDLRSGQIREYPSSGGGEDQSIPPELLSPAFFRPQVLDRYKADPEKYVLTLSTIECRGVWFLRSYDVNDAGQVYAYLKDLWSLPHSEQRYWRVFNEKPEAGITERSISQDFLAQPWLGPDPLRDLQWLLREFPLAKHNGIDTPMWSLNTADSGRVLARLHYLHTESRKEWQGQVLELRKVVVEGLQTKALQRVAQALNCYNEEWGSIKLLQACLQKRGVQDSTVQQVHDPLYDLNRLRSRGGVAHIGGTSGTKDLRDDYHRLLADVANAMTLLADLIRKGTLDLPLDSGLASSG
jgi:hypothetical protein